MPSLRSAYEPTFHHPSKEYTQCLFLFLAAAVNLDVCCCALFISPGVVLEKPREENEKRHNNTVESFFPSLILEVKTILLYHLSTKELLKSNDGGEKRRN
ncbi:hypothetical protein ACA910_009573 [Epithemia clementina (nom. ined.)]